MLPMLYADRNWSLTWLNRITRTTRPSTEGSAPGSPLRSLPNQERRAPPIDISSTSRENSLARSDVGSAPASTRICGVSLDMVPSDVLAGDRGREPDVTAAAGRDELDDLRRRAGVGRHLR